MLIFGHINPFLISCHFIPIIFNIAYSKIFTNFPLVNVIINITINLITITIMKIVTIIMVTITIMIRMPHPTSLLVTSITANVCNFS